MTVIENEIRRIVQDELLKRYHVTPAVGCVCPAELSGGCASIMCPRRAPPQWNVPTVAGGTAIP